MRTRSQKREPRKITTFDWDFFFMEFSAAKVTSRWPRWQVTLECGRSTNLSFVTAPYDFPLWFGDV